MSAKMAEYVTNIDYNVLATVKEELERKERQQKLHYFLLEQLQSYCRELPSKFQQRLSYDLLTGLANSLLDGTVFDIVNSLKEVQEMEEKSLFQQRTKLINEHRVQKQELVATHREELRECESRRHALGPLVPRQQEQREQIERRQKDELFRMDVSIIKALDQRVITQQDMLSKTGLPGFSITNCPTEQKLQMYLLNFIVRLRVCVPQSGLGS